MYEFVYPNKQHWLCVLCPTMKLAYKRWGSGPHHWQVTILAARRRCFGHTMLCVCIFIHFLISKWFSLWCEGHVSNRSFQCPTRMNMKDVCNSVSTYIQTKILIEWMARSKQYLFNNFILYGKIQVGKQIKVPPSFKHSRFLVRLDLEGLKLVTLPYKDN